MFDENEIPKITEEKKGNNRSVFVIDPIFPGYGATLGNALRRVLLSSMTGTAITYVKLDGVAHEFSAIPHVKEDMIEIIMNLRKIIVKSHSDEPVTIEIAAKGPKEVTAADFKANSSVEILNPEQHIATLDSSANFNLEVTLENGRGYQLSEERQVDNTNIGRIAIDSVFSPVNLVNFNVERTRVGNMTNYDKIELDVTTNGTITAREALTHSGKILVDYFNYIASGKAFDFEKNIISEIKPTEESLDNETASPAIDDIDPKTKIEDINLSSRTVNSLVNAGIKTVAGLKRLSDLKISEIKGLGKKGFLEIQELLGR